MSYNVSSVSTVRFLSGLLSNNDPVAFSLLTRCSILCLLGTGSPGNTLKFSTTYSSRLAFEIDIHKTHALQQYPSLELYCTALTMNGKLAN
jgi:hypothetical protein